MEDAASRLVGELRHRNRRPLEVGELEPDRVLVGGGGKGAGGAGAAAGEDDGGAAEHRLERRLLAARRVGGRPALDDADAASGRADAAAERARGPGAGPRPDPRDGGVARALLRRHESGDGPREVRRLVLAEQEPGDVGRGRRGVRPPDQDDVRAAMLVRQLPHVANLRPDDHEVGGVDARSHKSGASEADVADGRDADGASRTGRDSSRARVPVGRARGAVVAAAAGHAEEQGRRRDERCDGGGPRPGASPEARPRGKVTT